MGNWNNYSYVNTSPSNSVPYARSFMMDRYIGMLSTAYIPTNNGSRGWVGFGCGRKDPIPFHVALYNISGNAIGTSTAGFAAQQWGTFASLQIATVNTVYGIAHPMNYNISPLGNFGGVWNDVTITSANNKVQKSIFDPCPVGWMIPYNPFEDFRTITTLPPRMSNSQGMHYYPNIDPILGTIYYPNHGIGYSNGDSVSEVGEAVRCWITDNFGNALLWKPTQIWPLWGSTRGTEQIRCISM